MNATLKTFCATAVAASSMLIASPAADAAPIFADAGTLPAYTGTATFTAGSRTIHVDHAVYAPGAYGIADPSGGDHYVYAYQAFVMPGGSGALTTLSIGLADNSQATNVGVDLLRGIAGGEEPEWEHLPSVVLYDWFMGLSGGDYSSVMLYTSPHAPQLHSASVLVGGFSYQGVLPSPVPEPATLGLLAIGAVALVRRRRTH